MTWAGFAAVFAGFFLTHSVPVRPAIKSRIITPLGLRGFNISYSILSLGMLTLLIWSAGRAPFVALWAQMAWQRHVAHLGMLCVCLILALGLARPKPFSFGRARNDAFDPAHPGIVRLFRHPILVALAIWAAVHVLPNGDVAHVLLFGVLGGFAIGGCTPTNRRKRAQMGSEVWNVLNDKVTQAPRIARPVSWSGFALRLASGAAGFAVLIHLHRHVIGVTAL